MSWPHSTDGQNGTIVKTKTATYFPRLAVGAISEVAARAVSSEIPAPMPAMTIPPVSSSVVLEITRLELTNEWIHRVDGRADDHANHHEERANQSNVSTSQEVRERANEGADAGESEKVSED